MRPLVFDARSKLSVTFYWVINSKVVKKIINVVFVDILNFSIFYLSIKQYFFDFFWPIFWFLTKFSILKKNLDFWLKFLIFDKKFDFWPKFRFLTKFSIFQWNFNFVSWKFQFFEKKNDFWPKFRFFPKFSIFHQIFDFSAKF